MNKELFVRAKKTISTFLRGGYGADAREQDKHRAVMINTLFAFGFCFTFFTGVARLILGEYVIATIDFAWTIVIFGFLALFHKLHKYDVIAFVLLSLLGLMFFLLLTLRDFGEAIFVWYYSFPLIAVFLLGAKKGAVLSLAHLALTAIYLTFFAGIWNTTVFSTGLSYRFLSSYFVVISLAYVFQWLKERSISRLQQKTEELTNTKLSLEKAIHAKSDFLANMSHELRTPLNHIIGFTQLSHGGRLGEIGDPHKEHLGYVLESSRHLLSLIEDILDTSKIEAGKLQLSIEQIPIDEFLLHCIEMFGDTASSHNIELSSYNKSEFKEMHADKRKLKQIAYNLLSNALKFTPAGGRISIRAFSQATDAVTFGVADTGIGISTEEAERIFEPFFQAEIGSGRIIRGTGLGLSLTKSLVELHGGKIWLESRGLNEGSEFFFTIPMNLSVS
ncbi:MAG: HAMP domain-containing histidine kinase [Spirochaetales bacterium]|nr:HAMP domain-containing histidine kinase [Spirochaetales bacterium]